MLYISISLINILDRTKYAVFETCILFLFQKGPFYIRLPVFRCRLQKLSLCLATAGREHSLVLRYAVCVPFPFGVKGSMWNSTASVPDHCISYTLHQDIYIYRKNLENPQYGL